MADYWESSGANAATEGATIDATNGAAQPTANGDATMDDDILVWFSPLGLANTPINLCLVNSLLNLA